MEKIRNVKTLISGWFNTAVINGWRYSGRIFLIRDDAAPRGLKYHLVIEIPFSNRKNAETVFNDITGGGK